MFFPGTLEEGIQSALRDKLLVICFVKGADPESEKWETYLKDEAVRVDYVNNIRQNFDEQVFSAADSKAIILQISEGSREALFLSAFCPVPYTPSLIVIDSGVLKTKLEAGLTEQQFKETILSVLTDNPEPATAAGPPPEETIVSSATSETTHNPRSNASSPVRPSTRDVLEERRRRLEADKKAKEVTEKENQKARLERQRAEATENPNSARAQQLTYAAKQKKIQQEARLERERILKTIENDKQRRKEQEKLRKDVIKSEEPSSKINIAELPGNSSNTHQSTPNTPDNCALQVRLFDGSTIRSKFSKDVTLRSAVRPWIDSQSNINIPYNFRQVLAPKPNRLITISEEEETLQSLGLLPSATLVMIPVQEFTTAYSSTDSSLVSKGLSAGYNLGSGLLTSAMSLLTGTTSSASSQTTPTSSQIGTSRNIRTLGDEHASREQQQLYNGNQLNFEPRNEDEGK